MKKEYILAELRCALLKAKRRLLQEQIAVADIEAIGIALRADLITPDEASDAASALDLIALGEATAADFRIEYGGGAVERAA